MPLVQLGLTNNTELGAVSAHRIANTPRFASLERLGLAGTVIGQTGVDALIASPYLPRTLELLIEGEYVGLEDDGRGWWKGTPSGPLAARFRVVADGHPSS